MRIITAILILTAASTVIAAQNLTRCFQNDALKGKQIVKFQTRGNRFSGTFEYENGESELAQAYKFTGDRVANGALRVRFENDVRPDVAPSEMKSLMWTLTEKAGTEILRIGFYGKNYETNRYADYFVDFTPCEPDYNALLKMARPVRFAKGNISATVPVSFKSASERKVFSLNVRRGQTLSIVAASCKIWVYLPGGGLYEFVEWEGDGEKTFVSSMIDRATVKSIPKTGIFLIVLGKMSQNSQPDAATFKVTN